MQHGHRDVNRQVYGRAAQYLYTTLGWRRIPRFFFSFVSPLFSFSSFSIKEKSKTSKKNKKKGKRGLQGYLLSEMAQKMIFEKEMLEEIVQQLRPHQKKEGEQPVKPWTLKIALHPSSVLLVFYFSVSNLFFSFVFHVSFLFFFLFLFFLFPVVRTDAKTRNKSSRSSCCKKDDFLL